MLNILSALKTTEKTLKAFKDKDQKPPDQLKESIVNEIVNAAPATKNTVTHSNDQVCYFLTYDC